MLYNCCQAPCSIEVVEKFLEGAPVSRTTIQFLMRHLHKVPPPGEYVYVSGPKGAGYFERDDYLHFLTVLGEKEARVLVLSGRRRTGKTVALPHLIVKVRENLLKRRDKLMFYYPGDEDDSDVRCSTVIRLLAHLKIPAVFDEFTAMTNRISRCYKVLLENSSDVVDPLSAVLFGSNEAAVWTEGTSSIAGCATIGGIMRRLPSPPLTLMYNMLLKNEPWLQGSELGKKFLRKMTLHGADLSSHMSKKDANLTLQYLRDLGLQQISFTSCDLLKALKDLVFSKGCARGVDYSTLVTLQEQEYIVKRPNNPEYYDFLDPRLIAFKASYSSDSLEKTEGKVLELLLCLEKHLLPQLIQQLGISNTSIEEVVENMWHGNLTKSSEIDLLFFCNGEAFLISAKRSQDAQHWESSFIDSLNNLCKEWKQVKPKLQMKLSEAGTLHLVAVSADGSGEVQGKKPSSYSPPCRQGVPPSNFIPKQVTCQIILLHQLIEQTGKLQYLRFMPRLEERCCAEN